MNEHPGWIRLMFKRSAAGHALKTAYLLNSKNEWIAEQADGIPNGRQELRCAALEEIESDDPQIVALALIFLGVVGHPDDLTNIQWLTEHRSDMVRRAARTCCFELQQAGRR